MDFVEGPCLADVWPYFNSQKRRDVVLQVADMIKQMQSIEVEKPGPIGGRRSEGLWFTD